MEKVLYTVLSTGIRVTALIFIVPTILLHILAPEIVYSEGPIPPLRDRVLYIVIILAIGVAICIPYRWTLRTSVFWSRFAVYLAIAGYFNWMAINGIIAGLGGGKSPEIFPTSILFACFGLALPLCLLWSRRVERPS